MFEKGFHTPRRQINGLSWKKLWKFVEQNGDKTVNSENSENIGDTEWGKQRAYNAAQQPRDVTARSTRRSSWNRVTQRTMGST